MPSRQINDFVQKRKREKIDLIVARPVPITFERPYDAFSIRLALELVFRTVVTAHGLVRPVSTIVHPVADLGGEGAVLVSALVHPWQALPLGA